MLHLKLKRIERRLTQAELGEMVGVSARAIYQYESDRRKPDKETLQKLATALGCEIKDIEGQDNDNCKNHIY